MAPIGLVLCSTISIVSGYTLILNNYNSRKYSVTLSILGLFGIIKLGVLLYIELVISTLSILLLSIFIKK